MSVTFVVVSVLLLCFRPIFPFSAFVLSFHFLLFNHFFSSGDSIPKRCKGVHCVDLGESCPTHIYLQSLASIQPRTSPNKFVSSSSRSFNLSSRALPPTWPRPKYCVPQAPPKMRTLRPTGTAAWPARFSQTLSRSEAATNHVFFSGSYLGSDS